MAVWVKYVTQLLMSGVLCPTGAAQTSGSAIQPKRRFLSVYIASRIAVSEFSIPSQRPLPHIKMAFTTYWKTLSPGALNFWIQTFSLIAIFFEGYDQGVMGGVK